MKSSHETILHKSAYTSVATTGQMPSAGCNATAQGQTYDDNNDDGQQTTVPLQASTSIRSVPLVTMAYYVRFRQQGPGLQ